MDKLTQLATSTVSQFFIIVAISTIAVFFFAFFVRSSITKAKYRSLKASGFFWALQFLGLSDLPPPTPQEQAEQETREKKNRGSSDRL